MAKKWQKMAKKMRKNDKKMAKSDQKMAKNDKKWRKNDNFEKMMYGDMETCIEFFTHLYKEIVRF